MTTEIILVKAMDGSLHGSTDMDNELLRRWKTGDAMRVSVVKIKERSLQHHRLYFGGLLKLALDYWEPKGGLISSSEKSTLIMFADWLDFKGGKTGAIRNACKEFLIDIRDRRAKKIDVPSKDINTLHEWVKIESGYFEYKLTPRGIIKKSKSINFNAMKQDEFNVFYKAAFGVIWNFILSRAFNDEEEAQCAVNKLLGMG